MLCIGKYQPQPPFLSRSSSSLMNHFLSHTQGWKENKYDFGNANSIPSFYFSTLHNYYKDCQRLGTSMDDELEKSKHQEELGIYQFKSRFGPLPNDLRVEPSQTPSDWSSTRITSYGLANPKHWGQCPTSQPYRLLCYPCAVGYYGNLDDGYCKR